MVADGSRDLYAAPVEEVAPRLLGAVLRHETREGVVALRLTEVEAYGGADDAGSHAYRGPTRRNAAMFGPSGRYYTYLSHGIHVCANIVTGPPGVASAVLLRAGEIVAGRDLAQRRRGETVAPRDLARGPGRLAKALGITLAADGAEVDLRLAEVPASEAMTAGPRVGLRGAPERPWRFWLAAEPTVSPYRAAAPRRPSP